MDDWWQNYPWRLIQTNLREIDMRDIRADRVVSDLQTFRATVLMINAAGIIASYPTKLPFHFQSPYLTGDSLKDILKACHAADLRVIARTDFSKVRRPIYEAHPDWAYRSPGGQIVDYNGDVHVCVNSPYQQECMLQILEELLTTHEFDGVFFNMSGYQTHDYSGNYFGVCHCANCERGFRDMFDLALPKREDPEGAAFREYEEFKRRTLQAHHDKVYNFLVERWPHLCIANHLDAGRGFIRQESNTALDRPLPHWQYDASENTKWALGSYPKMISSNTTVDFIDFPYRHVAVSPHQQALRLAQNLANGGALDYYLIGRLDNHEDRSGFAPIKGIFHYHAAHEAEYIGLHLIALILLIKPKQGNQAEFRGWFRVLTEYHFPFDIMTEEASQQLSWDRYQALILPEIEAMSTLLTGKVDQFVSSGGTLIQTGPTRSQRVNNVMQQGFAPTCLGIEQILAIRSDMRSSYFKFTDKSAFPHFSHTDLVYMDGSYVYAQYTPDTQLALQLIPPHNFGPPERCFYDLVTDYPGFIRHPFGRGQAIYLPWSPGALFYRQGYPNTSDFLADLLQFIAGLTPVGGNLPHGIEITRFEQAGRHSELMHLVNTSGHFGNSFYAPLPLFNLEIVVACDQPPTAVEGLLSGLELEHHWSDQRLMIHIQRLELFEAIKISYIP